MCVRAIYIKSATVLEVSTKVELNMILRKTKPKIFTTNPLKKRLVCFCSKIFAYIKFLERQPGKVILATLWLL